MAKKYIKSIISKQETNATSARKLGITEIIEELQQKIFVGDIFIVPNKALDTAGAFKYSVQMLDQVSDWNGYTFDARIDKFLQVWYTCPELNCMDVPMHGMNTRLSDGTRVHISMEPGEYLPSNMFLGRREGDRMQITLPATLEIGDNTVSGVRITMLLTLAQTTHKYAYAGTFQTAFDAVVNHGGYGAFRNYIEERTPNTCV